MLYEDMQYNSRCEHMVSYFCKALGSYIDYLNMLDIWNSRQVYSKANETYGNEIIA